MAAGGPPLGVRRGGPGLKRAAAALLAALLAACAGLTEDEQARLEVHRENARRYFEARDFVRAQHQSAMALALDPEDVTMRLVRGHSLLRLGSASANADLVEQALDTFRGLHDDEPDDDRVDFSLGRTLLARALLLDAEIVAAERRAGSEFLPAADRRHAQDEVRAVRTRRSALLAEAERVLRDGLANPLQKDNPAALTDLVLVLHAQEGRDAEALPLAERTLVLLGESSGLARTALDSGQRLAPKTRLELEGFLEQNTGKEAALRDLVAAAALRRGDSGTFLAQLAAIEAAQGLAEGQYWARAGVFEQLGRFDEAARDLEQFLRLRTARHQSYADDPLAPETFRRIEDLRARASAAPR